jgi:hypothetical protein
VLHGQRSAQIGEPQPLFQGPSRQRADDEGSSEYVASPGHVDQLDDQSLDLGRFSGELVDGEGAASSVGDDRDWHQVSKLGQG